MAGVGLVITTPALAGTPFLPFFALVALTARAWGFGPTVLSIVISSLAVDYFVFEPTNELSYSKTNFIQIFGFIFVSLLIAGIARERTKAEERMRASLDELREASHAQRSALERLRRAQEIGKVASWELELGTGRVSWSENAGNVFEGSKLVESLEEFIDRIDAGDRGTVMEALTRIAKEPLDMEFRVLDDTGMPRWYHTRSLPQESPDGGPTKLIAGATADVTESHESAKALMNVEKLAAAGRMSATIAHEINNPLEAVMNLVFLAKSDAGISAESRQMLQQAEVELGRTAHIARQNLGFYRDRAVPAQVDLRALLIELAAIYATHARRKNIRVNVDGDNLMMTVRLGDVRQAVSNVLLNALDATPDGGEVHITLRPIADGALITIRDSGLGVPQELRERIFEPFFTTKKDYGTGLGLWVTRELLRSCGGDVRLTNSESGAEFELTLHEAHLRRSDVEPRASF